MRAMINMSINYSKQIMYNNGRIKSKGSNKLQEANHVQNCKTNNNDQKEQMATNQTRKAFEKKNCQPSIKLS